MKICLKTAAKLEAPQHVVMTLDERLPCYVQSPVVLTCDYRVDMCQNYHLLTLDLSGVLTLTCQRCLTLFEYDFTHQTMLAICQNEAQAEKLMEQFDCIVAVNGERIVNARELSRRIGSRNSPASASTIHMRTRTHRRPAGT